MDKSSLIGIFLGFIAIGIGMVLKGVSVFALFNPAALLIIFVGTAASVLIAFPMTTVKNIPTLFKIIFKEDKGTNMKDIIDMFATWSNVVRREGLLALESKIDEVDDTFIKSGLNLVVDGQSTDFIRDILLEKIDAMEQRHERGARVFTQAGTYAPTLGVLGAVVGLISALGHMEDIDTLGYAISSAFIATLFGIFSGYVLWHPFANKLKEKSKAEVHIKLVKIEGILSVSTGESPVILREKLSSYLSQSELKQMEESEELEDEKKA